MYLLYLRLMGLTNNCNGCGGYTGPSTKFSSNNGMRKRGLTGNDDKVIVNEMVKNGTLKFQGLALEIYNHNQGNSGNLIQSASAFNITALHDKYYGQKASA